MKPCSLASFRPPSPASAAPPGATSPSGVSGDATAGRTGSRRPVDGVESSRTSEAGHAATRKAFALAEHAPRAPELGRPSSLFAVRAARASAGADRPWDEMVAPEGTLRPEYRCIAGLLPSLTPEVRGEVLRRTRDLYEGKNPIDPVPRLVTRSERDLLVAGTAQRATALRRFLEDHYSGRKAYAAIIPPEKVARIIEAARESGYAGVIDGKNIAFPYGPDIMRDQTGQLLVIEDNVGYLGGPGTLVKNRETYREVLPRFEEAIRPIDRPLEFFENLAARARQRAIPADGKIVLLAQNQAFDDRCHADEFERAGVECFPSARGRKLACDAEGVFIEGPDGQGGVTHERVGFVFINGEPRLLDASHPATLLEFLLREADLRIGTRSPDDLVRVRLEAALEPDPSTGAPSAERIERALLDAGLLAPGYLDRLRVLPGLTQALLDGKVATSYTPGTSFVRSKDFKAFVDDLVRFYLKEPPLLPSVPVIRLSRTDAQGREIPDEVTIERLLEPATLARHVFKEVIGYGGYGVHIGPKLDEAAAERLRQAIRAAPERFVAEPFRQLSTLEGHLVDLRMIGLVDPERVEVTPTPYGRGTPADGDGKVNISQHGKEIAVFVVEDPAPRASASPRAPVERATTP